MVNYAPLLNAPDIGQQFAQGVQQGRETRLMGQRDSALQALSANPNDPNAINALMAVDPRTAMAFEERGARQAEQQQAAQRNAAFGQALGGLEGLPEPVKQLASLGDPQGAMQLWQVVQTADAAKLKAIDEDRQRKGSLLIALQDVPEAQRAQAAAQLAPQYGVQSLDGLDLSNAGIQRSLGEAVGIGEMLKLRMQQANNDRNYGLQVAEFNANQNYRNASLGLEAARLRASQAPQPMSVGDQIKLMERLEAQQKAEAAKQSQIGKVSDNLAAVNEAARMVGTWTTGLGSTIPSKFRGSAASDLEAKLDTLRANLSFDTLAAMRAASPTGGALGAISDTELRLLGSTVASLSTSQSPAALRAGLVKVARHQARWQVTIEGMNPDSAEGRKRTVEILKSASGTTPQLPNSPQRPGARGGGVVDWNSLPGSR